LKKYDEKNKQKTFRIIQSTSNHIDKHIPNYFPPKTQKEKSEERLGWIE
jgi:hypothetical protein